MGIQPFSVKQWESAPEHLFSFSEPF